MIDFEPDDAPVDAALIDELGVSVIAEALDITPAAVRASAPPGIHVRSWGRRRSRVNSSPRAMITTPKTSLGVMGIVADPSCRVS